MWASVLVLKVCFKKKYSFFSPVEENIFSFITGNNFLCKNSQKYFIIIWMTQGKEKKNPITFQSKISSLKGMGKNI